MLDWLLLPVRFLSLSYRCEMFRLCLHSHGLSYLGRLDGIPSFFCSHCRQIRCLLSLVLFLSLTGPLLANNPNVAPQAPLDRQIELFWDDPNPVENGVVEYLVYRGPDSGGPYAEVGRSTVLTFIDTVPPGIYWYVVTAVNAGGESGFSNEVGTVPLPMINLRVVITLQVIVP